MKNPELNLKQKLTFSSLEELVNHHLKNDITLTYIELDYIFHHIVYKKPSDKIFNPTYKKLCHAVRYLMKNLTDKQFYSFVDLINNDFEFEMEYNINSDIFDDNFLGDEFAGYSYTCKNPETSKFLIELASKLQIKQKNSALDDFKSSLS